MASQTITLKSPTTRLFCFQKFAHDNPPKFRHNGLSRGASNVEGISTPWRLMLTYKRHRYTAHKKFMNGFAWHGFDPYGTIISTGRCQKTLVCKSHK